MSSAVFFLLNYHGTIEFENDLKNISFMLKKLIFTLMFFFPSQTTQFLWFFITIINTEGSNVQYSSHVFHLEVANYLSTNTSSCMHNFFISLGFKAKSFNEKFKFYFSNLSNLFLFYLQFYTELSTIDMQEVHVQKINALY